MLWVSRILIGYVTAVTFSFRSRTNNKYKTQLVTTHLWIIIQIQIFLPVYLQNCWTATPVRAWWKPACVRWIPWRSNPWPCGRENCIRYMRKRYWTLWHRNIHPLLDTGIQLLATGTPFFVTGTPLLVTATSHFLTGTHTSLPVHAYLPIRTLL